MLKQTDIVNVVVTTRPQRVYAIVNETMHTGRWKTVQPGEMGVIADEGSNQFLLNAAMMTWNGESHFTTTAQELNDNSGGWGIEPS
jgi:hypothetical protein